MNAAQKKAADEKVAAEKAESDRVAAEKAEADRIAAEQAEADRVAAEKAEADRLAAEQEDKGDETDGRELFTPRVAARAKAMIAEQLTLADRDEKSGPGGSGWAHNESKREEVTEWAAFLRFLSAQIERL